MVVQPRAEPTGAAIEEKKREADDDRREREGQVDQRVENALAADVAAHDQERAADAEDGVERDGDQRDEDGEPECVHRVGGGDRLPGGAESVLESTVEDHPERDDEQQGEVAERAEAEEVPRYHRASSRSGGMR